MPPALFLSQPCFAVEVVNQRIDFVYHAVYAPPIVVVIPLSVQLRGALTQLFHPGVILEIVNGFFVVVGELLEIIQTLMAKAGGKIGGCFMGLVGAFLSVQFG